MVQNLLEYKSKGYIISHYFYKKIEKGYLITTSHGGWAFLTPQEFQLLITNKFHKNPKLFLTLKNEGIILTEDNIKQISNIHNTKFSHFDSGVNLHIISSTFRCNHSCIYCLAESKPTNSVEYDMDEKTAKFVCDFILKTSAPTNEITIEFQGGEPLLNYSAIQFIINYLLGNKRNKEIKFRIVSNLTKMDDDILKELIHFNVEINTSLDGPKKLHNKNRIFSDGNSYNKVVYWIKRIRNEFKYLRVFSAPTITKFSLPYWKDIIDEYIKIGFKEVGLRHLYIAGFAKERFDKIGYSAEDFFNFWRNGVEYIINKNKTGLNFREINASIILNNILSENGGGYMCFRRPCGACISQLSYNYYGDIFACDMGKANDRYKLGNVKNSNYSEIKKVFLKKIYRENSICDKCVWRAFCGTCMFLNFSTNKGNIKELQDIRKSFGCKLRSKQIEYIFNKLIFDKVGKEILFQWWQKERMQHLRS